MDTERYDLRGLVEGDERASLFAALFERAPIGMAVLEPERGQFLQVNLALCRITGYEREELLALTLYDITHPADRDENAESYRRLLRGETEQFAAEKRYVRKDGESAWVRVHSSRVPLGGQHMGTVATIEEIGTRREAEDGLRQHAQLLELTHDAILVLEWDGTIRYWNRGAEDLYGYPPWEANGQAADALLRTRFPEDPEAVRRALLDTGRWEGELSHIRRDGSEVPVLSRWVLERDAAGRPRSILQTNTDLAARKQVEMALRRSDTRFAIWRESTRTIFWDSGPDASIDAPQPEFERFTGMRFEDYRGWGWLEAVHPDDRLRMQNAWAQSIAQRAPLECEVRYRLASGQFRWYVSKAVADESPGGAPRGWIAAAIGIDTRKQAEHALRESEAHFRTLADNIAQLAWMADPSGWIFWYNRRWIEYTGIPLEDMKGWGWRQVHHPEHVDRVTQKLRYCFETGQVWEDLFPLRAADGSWRWFLSRAVPIRDEAGRVVRWFGTNTDVTRQRETEQALRQALERAEEDRLVLEAMMEHIPLGITVAEAPDVAIRMVSRYGRELVNTGGERSRALHGAEHPEKWRMYRPGASAPAPPEEVPLTRAIRDGEVVNEESWYIARRDGARIPILCNAAPIRDARGRVTGGVMGWQDITRLRREEELRAQADRRKDEFLAMLAHELRNPLASIRNAVGVMRALRLPEPHLQHVRDIMERQSQHLSRLVDDLLDVARITSGKVVLHRQQVQLADIAHRSVETARPLIDARRHALSVSLPEEPVWLDADEVRLTQVVGNLLNNAAKYTPDGGDIQLEAEAHDGQVVIRVSDSGVGIAPELLPHVFELFTQAERGRDRTEGGLGIGLTIVKSLVEMHGGEVRAFSEPGRGSSFELRLPVSKTPPAQAAAAAADAPAACRILVVDDNRDAAESVALLLQLSGHEVSTAYSGSAAIEMARQLRPQALILDIGLPGMDGYELARRLRDLPETREALLIALTGYGSEQDRQRGMDAGFDHYLVKPVDPSDLYDALRSGAP